MSLSEYRHRTSVRIDRSPEEIYDLIADVSLMGRWSPDCTGGAYDEDGEWFTGTNAMGGTIFHTRCRVVTAERGRAFAFVNYGTEGTHEMVRWSFELQAVDDGTEVVQTWEVLPTYAVGLGLEPTDPAVAEILDLMKAQALAGMPRTLEALKADIEQG